MNNEIAKVIAFNALSHETPELSAFDAFCLYVGLKVMKVNPKTSEPEPKWSFIAWMAVVAIVALLFVVWFFGRAVGRQEGIEEGREKTTIENLQKQVETLQKQKADEERFKNNLQIANQMFPEGKQNSNVNTNK